MNASNNIIDFKQVTIALKQRIILENIDLSIQKGEFIGVLGPNGAGKTTLFRALLGLAPILKGSAQIFQQPVKKGNIQINYMPQIRAQMSHLPIRAIDFMAIAMQGHRWGLPYLTQSARAEITHVLKLVDAQNLANRNIAELSGGERQRLLLAQCLLGQPKLILLDEPLISLDPHRQVEVIQLVKHIQQQLDITVLFSSHELNPLLPVLDFVLYLGNRQAKLGTIDEVINQPVLSALYGAPIEVLRFDNKIFVMSAEGIQADNHIHSH